MHIRLIAVGERQPSWVDDAVGIYAGRMPPEWRFRVDEIPSARRGKKRLSGLAADIEGASILAKLSPGERVVLLDERGEQLTSTQLARKLTQWQGDGRDLCFVIGGPDGVSDACRKRADTIWSLSQLTLPHGMARALFCEQLYRAWSLQAGHPYHRE